LPIEWPRVPGHEAVGRIDVIGEGVEGWAVGQRVGVSTRMPLQSVAALYPLAAISMFM
jgi:D-arabinose 1-dehydrogenase-like Zn-dependent alcohol dehydrogenase